MKLKKVTMANGTADYCKETFLVYSNREDFQEIATKYYNQTDGAYQACDWNPILVSMEDFDYQCTEEMHIFINLIANRCHRSFTGSLDEICKVLIEDEDEMYQYRIGYIDQLKMHITGKAESENISNINSIKSCERRGIDPYGY